MVKKTQIGQDEINLGDTIRIIYESKWRLFVIIIISVISVFSLNYPYINNFTATTQIESITTAEEDKYTFFNDIDLNKDIFKVSRSQLLDNYLEIINDKSLFEDAMHKYNIIDSSKYSSEKKYKEAIIKYASSIRILSPVENEDKERSIGTKEIQFNIIEFEHDNKKEWKDVLRYVDEYANKAVKINYRNNFETLISILEEEKKNKLQGLLLQIDNLIIDYHFQMAKFKLEQGFKLDDVDTEIKNVLSDYKRSSSDRLSFLKEQAAMARELNIAKNTIEAQTFSAQNGILTNIKSDSPFYLRGYEAIEKEIELIKTRENIYPFVTDLFDLEKKKRELEQNKTLERANQNEVFLTEIVDLQKQVRKIKQDNNIEKIKLIFASTPLGDNNNFYAASQNVSATKFKYRSIIKPLIIAAIAGLIFGIFYIFIYNSLQSTKINRKK